MFLFLGLRRLNCQERGLIKFLSCVLLVGSLSLSRGLVGLWYRKIALLGIIQL